MTAPQPATPDPVDDVSLSWALSDETARPTASVAATAPASGVARAPEVLVTQLVGEIHDTLPAAWSALEVEIAIANNEHRTRAIAELADGRLVPISVSQHVITAAAAHRELTTRPAPWMWLQISQTRGGQPQIVSYDGFVGSPPTHLLFSPETYRNDLCMSAGVPTPLWLLAHLNNQGAQLRSATQAATAGPSTTVEAGAELPPLPVLWPRFAALAAIFAGLGTPDGPRMTSSFGVFRGEVGGCTLHRLPGGRAVLSGGADHSALLTAAYQGQISWPDLYAGAPRWVNNLVLDDRALGGMLSFCYWWADGHWSRSAVPGPTDWSMIDEITPAVPGVWTSSSTADLVHATMTTIDPSVTIDDCAAYVAQVDDANTRPALLLAEYGSTFAPAEGLAVLDLAQGW